MDPVKAVATKTDAAKANPVKADEVKSGHDQAERPSLLNPQLP
jgi:hypothetical protein